MKIFSRPNSKLIPLLIIIAILIIVVGGFEGYRIYKKKKNISISTQNKNEISPSPSASEPLPPNFEEQQRLNDLYGHTD